MSKDNSTQSQLSTKLAEQASKANWSSVAVSTIMRTVLDNHLRTRGQQHQCPICKALNGYQYRGLYMPARAHTDSTPPALTALINGPNLDSVYATWICQRCGHVLDINADDIEALRDLINIAATP